MTLAAAHYVRALADQRDRQRFASITLQTSDAIQSRVDLYVALLRGLASVFAADESIELAQLRRYAARLMLEEHYGGIQGIGFARRTLPEELPALEGRLKGQGVPGFQVWPSGERAVMYPIVFLYPPDQRNIFAMGYDMFEESVRREAMEIARDTGRPAASARVTLVQEIDPGKKQAGFLIYLPVYLGTAIPESLDERRADIIGFAYSPFRADDLLRGIFGSDLTPHVDFQVFDGIEPRPDGLLHDSRIFQAPLPDGYRPRLSGRRTVSIANRDWTLLISTRPSFDQERASHPALFILVLGLGTALLLLWGSWRRFRVEEALEESEERFRTMADSAPVLIWMSDADQRGAYFNRRWLEFRGKALEEELGDGWLSGVHPDDGIVLQSRAQAFAQGRPFTAQFRMKRHDGEYRYMLDTGVPRSTPDGMLQGFIGSCSDITEIKQLEEQRLDLLAHERELRSQAEISNRMKDEFVGTLSHELRTPLNAILGWSQIVRRKLGDPKLLEQGLDVIERNARSQAQIIEDLLDMNRIVSGKMRLDIRSVDITVIVEDTIDTIKPAADGKRIAIEKRLDSTLDPVRGDADRLRQILWNLLSNAVKFTPPGGVISVTSKKGREGAVVEVKDTGQGIEPEFLPYVFDRFRQADASTSRKHGGLGLGLSIVKSLVELHGGDIVAESKGAGAGSVFSLTLPFFGAGEISEAEPGQSLTPPPQQVPLDDLTVLVVDDEPDSRAMIRQVLSEAGAEVLEASSGQEALRLVKSYKPDVLVSDIGMPELDGYELLRRIRELPAEEGGEVPAIALTAFARSEDRMTALRAGFRVHVPKPVEPNRFADIVREVARRI